jgi:hypothetical protein
MFACGFVGLGISILGILSDRGQVTTLVGGSILLLSILSFVRSKTGKGKPAETLRSNEVQKTIS